MNIKLYDKSSSCNKCPYDEGNYNVIDCNFPDCCGGWEKVYSNLNSRYRVLFLEYEKFKNMIERIKSILKKY